MQVTLISKTADAAALLLFTKQARLGLEPGRFDALRKEVDALSLIELQARLAYVANTIPSSWEFIDYTFVVEGVSRAYTHQQVRTRTGSYAQQSLRVVNKAQFDYVWPERRLPSAAEDEIAAVVLRIQAGYGRLTTELGVAAEDARGILPTNIATNIVCKFNLRTMAELAASRSGGRTQAEYIRVVTAMCKAVLQVHPWAYAFLYPQGSDYFSDIEAFAEKEFGGDLLRKGELLKIVDKMRKDRS